MTLRLFLLLVLFVLGVGAAAGACAASDTEDDGDGDCNIGSERCACTQGGVCDPGLECLSGICVNPNPGVGGGGGSGHGGSTVQTGPGGGPNCMEGCQAVDVLFALDSSDSMLVERNALAATQAFQQVVESLAAINCGQIEYRVGLTDDYDHGWIVPAGWNGATPWFDSQAMAQQDIVTAFNGAAAQVGNPSETPPGCEHVLTSATQLLTTDTTAFVRTGALLVLVLITDVDDYGYYDQPSGNSCGLGCTEPVTPVATLYNELVTLKEGNPAAVATVIVAGDPNVLDGSNFCSQPGSCGCSGLDCEVFHAYRLWEFAGSQMGMNGVTADLCGGPMSVPTAVESAFAGNIDLACQGLPPPK